MREGGIHELAEGFPKLAPSEKNGQDAREENENRLHLRTAGKLALLPGFLQPPWRCLLCFFSALFSHGKREGAAGSRFRGQRGKRRPNPKSEERLCFHE